MKEAHVLGNGPSQQIWHQTNMKEGGPMNVVCCNLPWDNVPADRCWGTVIGDFKMIRPISEGSIQADHMKWILGTRPKQFCDQNPSFYMKYAYNIREFYTYVAPYSANATDWSAGHLAVHYTCMRLQPEKLNMYGFDSLFSQDLSSASDFMIPSNRDLANRYRMNSRWRPIWQNMFAEMSNVTFVIHTRAQAEIAFDVPANVKVKRHP